MDEQQILRQLLGRQPDAATHFLRRYGSLLRYIIAPILPDQREREECVADVAMKVWQQIGSFDPNKGSFSTWLTVLTRNTALNRARAQKDQPLPLEEAALPPSPGPEEALLQKERSLRLHQTLRQLGNTDRALIYRKYYYLQSTAQIARELGMTERAVEGRLYRLKKKLKEKLGGDFHD